MVATATKTPKAKKLKTRTVRLLTANLMQITEDGKPDLYMLAKLPSDFGTAFVVEKVAMADGMGIETEEPYQVCLDAHGKDAHECGCKGFQRWGHRTLCRHVAALLKLRETGKLS